jgi:hypothetical protein
MEHCGICNKNFEGTLVAHLSSAHPKGNPSGTTMDWWVIPLLITVLVAVGFVSYLLISVGPKLSFAD